jgi:NodT family efflux transporter outer membrane factor (OMF) lipoprotein
MDEQMKKNQNADTTIMRLLPFVLAAVVLMTVGCTSVGPNYTPPDAKPPAQWHTPLTDGLTKEAPSAQTLAAWWQTLDDPMLDTLIEKAIADNLDVKLARARVREARARRGIAAAGQYPTLTANGAATKSGRAETNGLNNESDLFSLSFDAGWEIDLFGGARRSVEAAQAEVEAGTEALNQTLVSLLAETALNYVDVRTYQARLDVAQANLQSQQESYLIAESKYEAGLSSELAVQQARYNLAATRSLIPTLEAGLDQAKNRLAVLLGLTPGQLHEQLQSHAPIPVPPVTLAVGIPAETLQRRPDVRRYERLLAAQTARIGVAKADLYPKIRLSGSIGLEALSAGDLLNAATRTWRLGPSISWPIFNAGSIRRNIEVQSILQEEDLIQYESAVLSALEEVENSIMAYVTEQLRRQALVEAVEAARKAVKLAQDQYKAGLVDFTNVLDAQRSARSNEDSLAQSEGRVTADLISLYKSLGGGWTSYAAASQATSGK